MQFTNKIGNHRDQLALADFTFGVHWRPVRSIKDLLHFKRIGFPPRHVFDADQ